MILHVIRYAEQKSEKIPMKEGKFYYITVYQKAEKLGDCASVAVEMPSGHFEGPIKQKHLSWKLQGWLRSVEIEMIELSSIKKLV